MTGYLPPHPEGTVVTVGSFDGVHRGHEAVLREISARARAAGRHSVLVTFDPHPMAVVNPAAAPQLLTTGPERREILAQTALDYAVLLHFDRTLAAMPPERFVREVLVRGCGMRELVIGYDHGFGRGRAGDAELLARLGAEIGFAVDVVPALAVDGHEVSSTLVRRAVAGGDLALAARLLGRPYFATGEVVRGEGRGRTIGFPTANLAGVPARKLLPPDGVYAVRVEWRGGRADGMMNQGGRPTFRQAERALEVHLLDFAGDLYGEWLKVQWVARLRDVQRFSSPEALRAQLERDRSSARAALAAVATGTLSS
ncbi:MAG TPA: bifunctional riboflavin kinase/FAD synthetase [Gemmatimonadales bacterium]|nr:bifunctional riboflavin kinase/FAD synthetase [Gemmatimonadales bacterium]